MIRFYVEARDAAGDSITVRGDSLHYLKNVLRAERGMKVKAFDGRGNEHLCRIEEMGSASALLSIIESYRPDNESAADITLALGVSKPKSFEFALQKSTELGVKRIIPLVTRRSLPSPGPSKISRAEKIIISAARQCGRSVFPVLENPGELDSVLCEASGHGLAIIPWEEEENVSIGRVLEGGDFRSVMVLIGPEGGFTAGEVKAAEESGVVPVSLGPRILRAETAAAAVAAMIIYRFDLRG